VRGADFGKGRGLDWVASHPLFGGAENKIIETIVGRKKTNTLDRALIVIFTLWYC